MLTDDLYYYLLLNLAPGGARLQIQVDHILTAMMDAEPAELEGRTKLTDSEDKDNDRTAL